MRLVFVTLLAALTLARTIVHYHYHFSSADKRALSTLDELTCIEQHLDDTVARRACIAAARNGEDAHRPAGRPRRVSRRHSAINKYAGEGSDQHRGAYDSVEPRKLSSQELTELGLRGMAEDRLITIPVESLDQHNQEAEDDESVYIAKNEIHSAGINIQVPL